LTTCRGRRMLLDEAADRAAVAERVGFLDIRVEFT
jgi:hypothetical protein